MSEEFTLPIALSSDNGADASELYELTLALRRELLDQPVDSVTRAPGAAPEAGAKGIGPEETQLLVTLATHVLPPIIALLSGWLLRQKDHNLHVRVKAGEAEVDIPRGMGIDEVERVVKILTDAAKQAKKR